MTLPRYQPSDHGDSYSDTANLRAPNNKSDNDKTVTNDQASVG